MRCATSHVAMGNHKRMRVFTDKIYQAVFCETLVSTAGVLRLMVTAPGDTMYTEVLKNTGEL